MRIAHWYSSFIEKALSRGDAYTSLDAMKLFAIVNMTVDHVGYYFFPHDLWLRAIGRITFPVWFFLVGYSRSRELGATLWVYAIILLVIQPIAGLYFLPLNALFSIIFSRLVLNLCEDWKLIPGNIPELAIIFSFLAAFTTPFFEYGSIAFLYALLGRAVRQKESQHLLFLSLSSYIVFCFFQQVTFKFHPAQLAYVVVGTAGVVWWLSICPNKVIWNQWRNSYFKTFIAVLSRNTMPYYFYHRFIFVIVFAVAVKKVHLLQLHF